MKRSEKGVHEAHCSKHDCKYGDSDCPVVIKLNKTEQALLDKIRSINKRGALAGMITSPNSDNFHSKEARFIKRLYDNGFIVWAMTMERGAGWVASELSVEMILKK